MTAHFVTSSHILAQAAKEAYYSGDLDVASAAIAQQLAHAPHPATLANLVQVEVLRLPHSAWQMELTPLFQQTQCHDNRAEIATFWALAQYLNGDFTQAQRWLAFARASIDGAQVDGIVLPRNVQVSIAFCNYLERLLGWYKTHPIQKNTIENEIYVVGDSHIFSLAHQVPDDCRVMPVFVPGLKLWHLAQSQHNLFWASVLKRLNDIPKEASLILSCGEIDCRADEGILSHAQKNGCHFSEVIDQTLAGYADFLTRYMSRKHLALLGVPHASPEKLSQATQPEDLIKVIAQCNDGLRAICQVRGIKFIDVHAMTASCQSAAYLDAHHLTPEVMKHAFDYTP